MRLRFPELLKEHKLTAYQVAKLSNERISRSWAYRAKKKRGKLGTFGATEMEALFDIFGRDLNLIFEPDKPARR